MITITNKIEKIPQWFCPIVQQPTATVVAFTGKSILFCSEHKRFMSKLTFTFFLTRIEKYRPKTLDDLVSHKDIISTSKC